MAAPLTLSKERWLLIGFALIISVVMYLIFQTRPKPAVTASMAQQQTFGPPFYNQLYTDSFIVLARRAYAPFITIEKQSDELTMTLTKSNELAKDFFNGNDSLLQFDEGDYGFKIKYNSAQQSTSAHFLIQKNGSVSVPNDVLIKMLEKSKYTPIATPASLPKN